MKPIKKTLMFVAVMALFSNTAFAVPKESYKASQSRILAESIMRNAVAQTAFNDNVKSLQTKAPGEIRPRIVGGTEATEGAYPWMAALLIAAQANAYDAQYCGGSLIRKDLIVTAAHCVEFIADPSLIDVVVGAHSLSAVSAQNRIAVSAIFVHPDYDDLSLDNDIAVLKLSRDALQTPLPIINTSVFTRIVAGDLFTIMGWGTLFEQPVVRPDALQEVQVPYVDNQICNDALFDPNSSESLTNNQICAGLAAGGKDSCQGDSGGPLVYFDNDNGYLTGIVSWGIGCAQPDGYGVYTKTANYADWALQVADTLYVQAHYDFQYVGITETNEGVTFISNFTANATLIQDISMSGDSEFSISENQCLNTNLIPGARCKLAFKFKPTTAGSKSAIAHITESNGNTHTIALTGNGIATIEANAALDTKEWTWYSGIDAAWIEDQAVGGVNASAMRSGVIIDEQSSHILTYLEGPGTLRFQWKVSSEADYDFFDFFIDGELVDFTSGESDWLFQTIQLEPGTHSIRWSYTKDFSESAGMDAAWLDNVIYTTSTSVGGGSLAWFFLLTIAIGRSLLLASRK